MKNKILIISIIILSFGASLFIYYLFLPITSLKTAVKEDDIIDRKYILCSEAAVTGFDWEVLKDENGEEKTLKDEYCNIIGAIPITELKLSYQFSTVENNIFIFYIEDKRTYYSEEMSMEILEYTATGWDVLYPVKHFGFFFDFFTSKKYITKGDVSN